MERQNYSSTSVTSQHFINGLDALIIQLTQAFSVEHQITPDPQGKCMTRAVLQERANVLLTDQEKEEIKSFVELSNYKPKPGSTHVGGVPPQIKKAMYNITSIMGLDYVK